VTSEAKRLVSEVALRHLDAAYNLGRWLLGNDQDASDAVHDAFVRASNAAGTYAGGNARAWWLAIVRNCCLARLQTRRHDYANVAIDQVAQEHGREAAEALFDHTEADAVERRVEQIQHQVLIAQQLRNVPIEFREVLILREIEEMSYREIAEVLSVPIGTVMSRLARGRAQLQQALRPVTTREVHHGM
jgi:RNA polymerase sigma-70 factor (ECF subfamily)